MIENCQGRYFLFANIPKPLWKWYSPAYIKTSQRRRKNVLIFVLKTFQISLKWKSWRHFFRRCQDVFQETSSRRLPGDVLETSFKRRSQNLLKTSKSSSRLFLVKVKEHLRLYRDFLSTYVLSHLHITTPSLNKLIN